MAGKPKPLSARFVASVGTAGTYADGDGLYLIVSPTGAKRWTFIFFWHGKRKELGLGKLSAVSLASARDAAEQARRMVAEGVNPIEARRDAKAQVELQRLVTTFGMEAETYVGTHATSFRNAKHIAQWKMTLSVTRDGNGDLVDDGYCLPLRNTPVEAIKTEQVLEVLKPIWLSKPETASRLRGRIERVLDAAKVAGRRSEENPARWRGHLEALLPKRRKLTRGHHAAMPYADLPAFMAKLRESDGLGAAALELLILCTSRTGEIIGAKWDEVDLEGKVWIVPAERMKAGREHRVALSGAAVVILQRLAETRTGPFVFPGSKPNKHISNMTMAKALGAAGGSDFTVHGFRSTFRDWVGDQTSFPEVLAEMSLAHIVGDATERAYRRGDALDRRRKLANAWADYCEPVSKPNVVPMRQKKKAAG